MSKEHQAQQCPRPHSTANQTQLQEKTTESFAPTHPAAQESDPADREHREQAQKPAVHRTRPWLWTS